MENLEIKQIILQLEKQDSELTTIKSYLRKITDNDDNLKSSQENELTLKAIKIFMNQHNLIVSQILESKATIDKIKVYFSGIFDNLPLTVKHQFILRGKIKWQMYLLTAFLGLIVTLSAICYHNYKDNTDYEKAWKLILEEDMSKNQEKYLKSFLIRAQEK